MEALGFIETKGLIGSIEAADAMLKAAEVSLVERAITGGGYVTITIEGNVAAVQASVDAGVAAVNQFGSDLLFTCLVIPRPDSGLKGTILDTDENYIDKSGLIAVKKRDNSNPVKTTKEDRLEENIKSPDKKVKLESIPFQELRKMARECEEFPHKGQELLKLKKNALIEELLKYIKE